MSDSVTYNAAQGRYELPVDGGTVFARVRRKEDVLYIDYVEVPAAMRGGGYGGRFMTALMAAVRAEGLRVTPLCSYAASWLKRHNEHSDLLAE